MYRALTARGIYLNQDRYDISFAVKELSRKMPNPDGEDWERLKRLGRYLLGRPRMVQSFDYQSNYSNLHTSTDSDHAGCLKTRKSTSGGVVNLGKHVIKHWSSTCW